MTGKEVPEELVAALQKLFTELEVENVFRRLAVAMEHGDAGAIEECRDALDEALDDYKDKLRDRGPKPDRSAAVDTIGNPPEIIRKGDEVYQQYERLALAEDAGRVPRGTAGRYLTQLEEEDKAAKRAEEDQIWRDGEDEDTRENVRKARARAERARRTVSTRHVTRNLYRSVDTRHSGSLGAFLAPLDFEQFCLQAKRILREESELHNETLEAADWRKIYEGFERFRH